MLSRLIYALTALCLFYFVALSFEPNTAAMIPHSFEWVISQGILAFSALLLCSAVVRRVPSAAVLGSASVLAFIGFSAFRLNFLLLTGAMHIHTSLQAGPAHQSILENWLVIFVVPWAAPLLLVLSLMLGLRETIARRPVEPSPITKAA